VPVCNLFEGVPLKLTNHVHLPTLPKGYGGMYGGKMTGKLKTSAPSLKTLKKLPPKYINPSCHPPWYKEQTWTPAEKDDVVKDAQKFMEMVKGKHIVFMGDSTLRQVMLGLGCFLKDAGIRPIEALFSEKLEAQLKYEDGTVLSRWGLSTLTSFHQGRVAQEVVSADVLLVNMGRHYHHTMLGRKEYDKDIKQLVKELGTVPKSTQVVLTETLPGHFSTPSGDLYDKRGDMKHYNVTRVGYKCKAVADTTSSRCGHWRNKVLSKYASAAGIPVLPLYDVLADRWDAHLGFDDFGATPQPRQWLDCVHFCYSKELLAPILSRVQEVILSALDTLRECKNEVAKQ